MSSPNSPFTAVYTQWLASFRAMIPGGAPAGPAEDLARGQEQAAAHQEWEDEGGSVRPAEKKPGTAPAGD